jgi:GT2 family glycosyltransferase
VSLSVSIVIVNWHSCAYLRKCLASITACTQGLNYEVIVIDGASFDGVDRMIETEYPDVIFRQSYENLGFAAANNEASRFVVKDCVMFLNPDTELTPSSLQALSDVLNTTPDCGIVGARLLNSDGTVQLSCVQAIPTILNKVLDSNVLRSLFPKSRLWGMRPLFEADAHASRVDAISGACMLMRASLFWKVGGFSEEYFMYAEDVDLCDKVRRAGYRNYYVPSAVVWHHGGASSGQASSVFSAVMTREATWRFFRKTRGRAYAAAYRAAMLWVACVRLGLFAIGAIFGLKAAGDWKAPFKRWYAVLRWAASTHEVVEQHYAKASASVAHSVSGKAS